MPANTTSLSFYGIQKINGGIVAVGTYELENGNRRGFVYDHSSGSFKDFLNLFPTVPHDSSSFRSVNVDGIVVGNVRDLDGIRRSFWFDWLSPSPSVNFLDDQFAELAGLARPNAADINVHGDIVVDSRNDTSNSYCVNPFTDSSFQLPLQAPVAITDSGFILSNNEGLDPITNEWLVARWSSLDGKKTFKNLKISTEWGAINEFGEFGAIIKDGGAARGTACRVGTNINWTGPNNEAYWVSSVNGSGDLGYMHAPNYTEKAMFYHSGLDQIYAIDTLVDDSFLNNGVQSGEFFLTERDPSLTIPTPTIVGKVHDELGDHRIYFLIPQPYEPPPTYYSQDTPLSIPDNDPAGTNSNIVIGDDLQIAGLTVTLDISHPPCPICRLPLSGRITSRYRCRI